MLNIITIAIFETVTLVMLGGGVILFLGILALAVRCMRKVEPGTVGVRTGLGGIKVRDSWCVVLPLIHKYDIMDISVKRLEINRQGADGLICKDNLRADITVAFYIRVDKPQAQEVAQAVGCDRASEIDQLRQLFEAKFSEALKTAGKQFDFTSLYTERDQFKQSILEVIGQDLNGYHLEDAAIDYLEQTPLSKMDPNNVLDSIGIKLINGVTAKQAEEANQILRNKEKEIKRQDVEATEAILQLDKQKAEAEEQQKREIATITAREEAEANKVTEEERLKAESARINTEQELGVAEENKQRQIIVAQKNRERTQAIETERVEKDRLLEVTERERIVTLANIEKEKTIETEQKNIQEVIRERVELEKTVVVEKEKIKDTESFATADREKRVLITQAEMQAEEALVKDIKAAEAEKKSAELHAEQEKYKQVLAAEGSKEAAEMKAEEIMIAADSEEKAASKLAAAKKSEASGISALEAAAGLAQAQVISAKAEAKEKDGTAEANVMEIKFQAEAKGITEKAEAMKIFDGVGREHEEFKLNLNKDKEIELAQIGVTKDIAEQQALIVGEALKSANIDIVGGDNVFFDKITNAITQGKSVDRFANNSQVITDVKDTFFNGDPEYFKQKLAEWAGEYGLTTDSIKNLTISALIGQMISESKDSGKTSILKQALEMAGNFGIADNPANSVIKLPASEN